MKLYMMLLLCSASVQLYSQTQLFTTYKSWDISLQEASVQDKKILLYFGASWCVPCRQIEKEVFTDTAVIALIHANTIAYAFDVEDKNALPFLKKFRATSFPLIVIINKDGYLNRRLDGIPVTAGKFSSFLSNELKNNSTYPGISNSMSITFPSFYNSYFQGKTRVQPDSTEVDNYLKSQKNLLSEVNWDILSLLNTNDNYYYYLVSHKDEFKELYGTEVSFKVLEMYRRIAQRYIDSGDSVKYNYVTRLLTNPVDMAGKRAFLMREIKFLGNSGIDWEKFILKSKEYIQTYGNSSNHFICEYALEKKPDSVTIQYLLKIMEPILISMPYSDTYYKYGALLWYSGKRDEAGSYFEKTIQLASSTEQRDILNKSIQVLRTSRL